LYEAAKNNGGDVAAAATSGVNGHSDAALQNLINAYRSILLDKTIDGSMADMILSLPSQSELVQSIDEADPTRVHAVRSFVTQTIAKELTSELEQARPLDPTPALSASPCSS
jgi:aminopeptidase N